MNSPRIRRPDYIGTAPLQPLAVLAFVLVLLLACGITTQIAAAKLGFNPSLGRAWSGHIYAPWDILRWIVQFENPLARVRYPAMVYAALHQAHTLLLVGFGAAIASSFLGASLGRKLFGDNEQLFDTTKWGSTNEAEQLGLFQPAGPIVGALHVPLKGLRSVRYSGEKNLIMVEPPGGGKSSLLKTNLLTPLQHTKAQTWNEVQRRTHPWGEEPNILVTDLKGELFFQTSGYQRDVLRKDVYLLAPLGNIEDNDRRRLPDENYASYNPLWSIRIGTDHGYNDCLAKAQSMIDGNGEGLKTHWDRTSLAFGASVIEKLGFLALNRGRWEQFSLPGLAEFVSSMGPTEVPSDEEDQENLNAEALQKLLTFMKEEPDDPAGVFGWERSDFQNGVKIASRIKPSIYSAACGMERKEARERAGVYSTFIAFLAPYLGETYQKFASTSSFSWRAMASNDARASIVYLGMNPLDIPPLRPYIRMVLADALEELTRGGNANISGRTVRKAFRPFWIALDELAAFKKLAEIEVGSGFFRGYGVYLFLIFQSLAQLTSNYGRDEVLSETTGMRLFGRPERAEAAGEIEKELGYETVVVKRRSQTTPGSFSGGAVNTSTQESAEAHRIPLLTSKQIMQIEDDRLIAITAGKNFYLTKFPFFGNKALLERAKRKAVHAPPQRLVDEPTFVQEARLALGEEKWQKLVTVITTRGKTNQTLSEINAKDTAQEDDTTAQEQATAASA